MSNARFRSLLPLWLLFFLLLAWFLVSTGLVQRFLRPPAEPRAVTSRGNLAADEQAQIEIFRSVGPSVVFVTNVGVRVDRFRLNAVRIPQGTGSGFVWDDAGHIVTNFHVIRGSNEILIDFADGTELRASVVGVAPEKDLAVVRVNPKLHPLTPIPIGTSADLQVGQKVFAIGNPFGLDQTMTSGIVSALGRQIDGVGGRVIDGVIQTDAAINPGNSGGPLLDSAGRCIGVNTQIVSSTGQYAGIGFAVPIDTVNRVVPQLIQHGKTIRPSLGIRVGPGRPGVLVMEVIPGTGAERAGLRGTAVRNGQRRLGDVIVGLDGEKITTADDLLNALERRKPGDTVSLRVVREGRETDVPVVLSAPG